MARLGRNWWPENWRGSPPKVGRTQDGGQAGELGDSWHWQEGHLNRAGVSMAALLSPATEQPAPDQDPGSQALSSLLCQLGDGVRRHSIQLRMSLACLQARDHFY